MQRTWKPDVEIDVAGAHRVICNQFPEFGSEVPSELGRGWDNLCLVYPDGTAFRLPTRKLGAELLAVEMQVLGYLAARLPLPIPNPTYVGQPGHGYPYAFMGYAALGGETSDRLSWSREQRSALVPVLAQFCRTLHLLDPSDGPLAGLPPDKLFRKDPQALLNRIETRVRELATNSVGLNVSPDELLRWSREIATSFVPADRHCVVHGDLYPRHLLADADRALTGVIDWGDVHVGHPSVDLSLAFTFVPPADRNTFFTIYRLPVEESDIKLAQLRAAMYGTALVAYGFDVSDRHVLALGHEILTNLWV